MTDRMERIYQMYRQWDERCRKALQKDTPFRIAFCGTFSAGKSSLINAILDQEELLPTGIVPVTKCVTRLAYGSSKALYALVRDQKIPLPLKKLKDFITGTAPIPSGCQELVLTVPAPLLKNMELIDTPGYEDRENLEELSRNAVLAADLVVFCCNGTMLGKEFERAYLEEINKSHGNIILVVNRMDSINTEENMELIRQEAARLMAKKGTAWDPDRKNGIFFLTIAAGPYKNINGLDRYIAELSADRQKQEKIRYSSLSRCTAWYKDMIFSSTGEYIRECRNEIEEYQRQDAQEAEKIRFKNEMKKLKLNTAMENIKSSITAYLNSKEARMFSYIRSVDDPEQFVKKAGDYVLCQMGEIPDYMDRMLRTKDIFISSTIETKLRPYLSCKLPEPQKHWVQTRGIIQRGLITCLSFIDGSPYLDDGCDLVWDDYFTPAVERVRGQMGMIRDRISQILSEYDRNARAQIDQAAVFLENPNIMDLSREIRRAEEVRDAFRKKERLFSAMGQSPDPEYLIQQFTEAAADFSKELEKFPNVKNMAGKLKKYVKYLEDGPISVEFCFPYADPSGVGSLIDKFYRCKGSGKLFAEMQSGHKGWPPRICYQPGKEGEVLFQEKQWTQPQSVEMKQYKRRQEQLSEPDYDVRVQV